MKEEEKIARKLRTLEIKRKKYFASLRYLLEEWLNNCSLFVYFKNLVVNFSTSL